jgi:NAD(P)-dependent dehydrogenase (short-subunit alcohol dehydrogenase family)
MKTNILCAILDHQGGVTSPEARSLYFRHDLRTSIRSLADLYDYARTKAATMNYVKSLAKQLGPKGIRVNGVAPGPIWTPLQISGGAPEEKYKNSGIAARSVVPGSR